MNIMVTGGAGYIGSHTAKIIRRRGHTPIVFDNLSRGWVDWVRYGPFVYGDVRDEEALYQALRAFKVDAVIHFAALALVEESVQKPALYFDHNVRGTLALVQAMARAGVRRLVFSSSAAVYGQAQSIPIAEDHPKEPTNPYGLSKWHAEQILDTVASTAGIRLAMLRYFNVVGNDPDGEIYERHEPETHVLPNLMRAALTGAPFYLFGTDHETPDGTAVRDYVDVLDLAEAHVAALDVLESRDRLISNVGRGCGVSVREMVSAVERSLGRTVTVVERPKRPGDPPELVADNTFLKTWFDHPFKTLSEVIEGMARQQAFLQAP
ncbi:UDP-glucose 4-epimerase GalE [Desulfosoma caldarium]|uniref:UDP-glucose 4-epimerase n=1 Tax=Desulfosoma caldarium TaxID=610254 RepID=A0A3N1UZP9_9BACT|nr:UDP-glucose 4-epimerase GalE [Desulfosoma caldarium]ROQ93331.1 UDP-arabinose 4-epimerase [Desulfosoma caldarium]